MLALVGIRDAPQKKARDADGSDDDSSEEEEEEEAELALNGPPNYALALMGEPPGETKQNKTWVWWPVLPAENLVQNDHRRNANNAEY